MKDLAVIFDMDGVIVNTNPYHAKAFEVVFDRHEITYSEKQFQEHIYGKHNSHIFTYFFGRKIQGEELIQLENEKENLFREIYRSQVKPIAFLVEFLQDLSDNQFKLGVATSAPRANMDLILDALDIRQYFQSTLGSENVELHKPHPQVYLKSADNLVVNPQDCFVFEDSYSGITAGLNAGMNVIGVLSSHHRDELPLCLRYIEDYKDMNSKSIMELLNHVV